jgi:lipase
MAGAQTLSRIAVNGVELALFEWPWSGPPLLFVHATGFHARCWDRVVAGLPGRHCYAVDMRGHGRSDKPPPPYAWRSFGEDVAALARVLGLAGAVGVGHSMGGHSVALAAAREPAAFAALLLLDPVILSPERYGVVRSEEHFAARRRDRWASPDEMVARFADRPPFSRWDPAVLRDYCDHGLLPAPDGDGFVLACPPAIEAAIYAASTARDADIYAEVAALDLPVRVVRSARRPEPGAVDMGASPTAPDLASRFRRGEDIPLPDRSHFIPMEAPGLVAAFVRELAR